MTDSQLLEIEARVAQGVCFSSDVSALVAEVRRLKAAAKGVSSIRLIIEEARDNDDLAYELYKVLKNSGPAW
jgi:hypothetical protein